MITFSPLARLDPEDDDCVVVSIVVLICCHNRKARTLQALNSLSSQNVSRPTRLAIVLFDDGSTDGTSSAVAEMFPSVDIICGDGNTFWSRSMAAAQDYALDRTRPTYILWLNDDVELNSDAIDMLIAVAHRANGAPVVVGGLIDAITRETTYSGYERTGKRPLQLSKLNCSGMDQEVLTFNGNVVLVPRMVYQAVGRIDPEFEHGYGDIDYGLRAGAKGFVSLLTPAAVGRCSRNADAGTWVDPSVPMRKRCALLFTRKGIPPGPYSRFLKRHGGRLWAGLFLATYTRALGTIVMSSLRRRDCSK